MLIHEMFGLRSFLYHFNLTIIDRFSSSCKYSVNGKQNVIKQFNLENKILYGSLVESRKQRRKSIGQEQKKKSAIDDSLETNSNNGTLNDCKKRGRKPKSTDLKTVSSSLLQLIEHDPNDEKCFSHKVEKSDVPSSGNAKKRVKSIKSINTSPNSKDVTLTSSEFVFKSLVPINDGNYPLENPEKAAPCNSVSHSVLNYSLSDPVMKYCAKFPSVSKILEVTMSDKSRFVLNKWQQNMISTLGQEGFDKYFKDLKTRGHDFHSAMCNRVLGKSTEVCGEVTQNALKSLAWMLEHVSNPLAVESATAHPLLEYKGIPDCILHFRGIPVVVDWKLSDSAKKTLKDTYDAPVQITAYIGALNHDPNYKWKLNHGLVVVAYTSGDPCDVFLLAPKHCQIYWRHWLLRCDKFKARSHFHTDHVIDEEVL